MLRLEDLLAAKKAAGRAKDFNDIRYLTSNPDI